MSRRTTVSGTPGRLVAALSILAGFGPAAGTDGPVPPVPKLPSLQNAVKGYTQVTPSDGGSQSMYTLYVKPGTLDILALLPRDYEQQTLLFGNGVAGGLATAGIQGDTHLVRWKRCGDRLALIKPQLRIRTSGDPESVRSHEQLFTDFSILDVPVVAEGEGGAPVIALDDLLVDRSKLFYTWIPGDLEPLVATIKKIKVFKESLSIAFEMPWRINLDHPDHGQLVTISYSLSVLPDPSDYTPRKADPRVGYFVTAWHDLARIGDPSPRQRYIKRWKLEKADPKLAQSPPRQPIVFYIDHKTPIRYRRWVREGILEWNKAFAEVGIVNAIEVYQQDAFTGAHMDKDPESINFNFFVWNSNDITFAIGPCRVDPRTGRILDADVVMNDGWLRFAADSYRKYLAGSMIEGLDSETLDWLGAHPEWDPRVRWAGASLEAPEHAARRSAGGALARGALEGRGAACEQADCRVLDLALARSSLLDLEAMGEGDIIDGAPEPFVGALVKDVVMHEVGHVLGLRHNFKASTVYTLEQINSQEWRDGARPIGGSVMDYNPINLGGLDGLSQGPYFMTTLGPYDVWAIRYGYAADSDLEGILAESAAPEHAFATDEDLYGPDPAARARDLGDNTLDFVDAEMALVTQLRARILERSLKKGEGYDRAREAYFTLLGIQARDIATLARYVGGMWTYRDRVGDSERNPTEPVPAGEQRRALGQMARYVFSDDAFGLTPELLAKMSFDRWFDADSIPQHLPDPQLDVHDIVLGAQASALTLILNPTKLRRIYDNEMRIPADQDALTVAELLGYVQDVIWSELAAGPDAPPHPTARRPCISSLRRNLQHEHLERMIDLTLTANAPGAVSRSVGTLSAHLLRELEGRVDQVLAQRGDTLDPYSAAHLEDARSRIQRALEAVYVAWALDPRRDG
jgi:hypothetical protein